MAPTHIPTPTSVLLWRPGELPDPGPVELGSVCCLRSTACGDRAVVYRTATEQGVVAVVDFRSAAAPRPGGGWCAPGVVHRVDPGIPRSALLAEEHLRPVFAHIRSRRALPADAAYRLATLLPDLAGLGSGENPPREPPRTEDGRWIIVDGRRWRTSDPELPADVHAALQHHLGSARSAVGRARRADDAGALHDARARVSLAKHGLGERGEPWWELDLAARRSRWASALEELDDR